MSYPYGPHPDTSDALHNQYYPYYTGDPLPDIHFYESGTWPSTISDCSCGRSTRHLWLTHWFRLLWMRERWG